MQVHNLVDAEAHLDTLRDWKIAGRVRYVGVTHYTAAGQPDVARIIASRPVDFVQINYSAGERDAEQRLLPLALERGVAVIANRPFGGGGLLRRLQGRPVPRWAAEIDCDSWAQLLLKFVVSHPAITCAIPATARLDHLRDNMRGGRRAPARRGPPRADRGGGRLTEEHAMTLTLPMTLPTSVVGSHGLPGWVWLAREAMDAGRLGALDLRELMEDATQVALLDQERAGVDVVSTGEMMRVRFIIGFYDRIDGHPRPARPAPARPAPLGHEHAVRGDGEDRRPPRPRHRGGVPARPVAHREADQGDRARPVHAAGPAQARPRLQETRTPSWPTWSASSTPSAGPSWPPAPSSSRSTSRTTGCTRDRSTR